MPRGGKREGAGRKPVAPDGTVRTTVTLPPSVVDVLRDAGGGNVSEGVRALVAEHLRRLRKRGG